MKRSLAFCVLAGIGYSIARATGASNLGESDLYVLAITALLAVGLYGSAFGIDLTEAKQHLRLICAAVTVGVVLKAVIIGGVMFALTGEAEYIIVGIAVAQIDPLSVAAVLGNDRMSVRARSILAAWASFDDPVTTLLTVYGATVLGDAFDLTRHVVPGVPLHPSWTTYLADFGANLLLVVVALGVWWWVRKRVSLVLATAVGVLVVGVDRFLMLGVAASGLFLRPPVDTLLGRVMTVAVSIAAVLLGMMLVAGVDVLHGIMLGIATFGSQILVGLLLTRGLPTHDRWHLAFAQQNGLTAIVLALLLEVQYDGVVEVVAPAILVVNVIHSAANALLDRHLVTHV